MKVIIQMVKLISFILPFLIITIDGMLRRKENLQLNYRFGNALRFPGARDEPPHSQRALVSGSHRLRFPAGVYVHFLR